jgi:glutamate synthase domain-containing protein 2
MSGRYEIVTRDAPPLLEPVSKYAVRIRPIEFLKMGLGILADSRSLGEFRALASSRPCIYGVYDRPFGGLQADESRCRGCLRCMVEHPEVARIELNRDYLALGDPYWKPEQVLTVWYEAATGRVPVRGAGYNGPFKGEGFDGIWTDMSEIVRPTRDGIHGREYISTSVEVGRKPPRLAFEGGRPVPDVGRWIELPLPIVFDVPEGASETLATAIARAAARTGTVVFLPAGAPPPAGSDPARVALRWDPRRPGSLPEGVRLVEFEESIEDDLARARGFLPDEAIVAVRLVAAPGVEDRALALARHGADVLHLVADSHGREKGRSRHLVQVLRAVHGRLRDAGIRDEVTLVAQGGITQAEHVPKAILCGADVVAISSAAAVALQGKIEGMGPDGRLRVSVPPVPEEWAVQRLVNLLGSWRDQLLEVLGAMGMREVRRLRGEVGRAIFADEIEAELFGRIFGPRQPGERPRGSPRTLPRGSERVASSEAHPIPSASDAASLPPAEDLATRVLRRHAQHIREGYRKLSRLDFGVPDALGGMRWTAELILATWYQAETGEPPDHLEYRVGRSGGGFDRLDFLFPERPEPLDGPPDTSIELNRRGDGPLIRIPIPVYGAGFSYGSVSLQVMLARAMAARALETFTSTGEGGYPEPLAAFRDHVITQIATGLFGVREETIRRARIVEFKYAQGAKPGLGGHLLGDKVTAEVAGLRESVPFVSLFSPFPFHSVYSVEDHKKHLDWVRTVNPHALVSVKVSTPTDVDMVAIGSYFAGAHIVHLDGGYGGTGAAPEIAKKNIAMPIEYALPKVHRELVAEGVRDEIVLMASGGIRTAWDVAKAIALGADGCVIGTAELVAMGCTLCRNCELGRGCPFGLTTTDPELERLVTPEWAAARLLNLYRSWRRQWVELLERLGLPSIRALRGRTDLLVHLDHGPGRPLEEPRLP